MIDLFYKAHSFWRRYGTRATIKRIRAELDPKPAYIPAAYSVPVIPPSASPRSAAQLSQARFESLTPLSLYMLPPSPHKRITIVTDSIARNSLFGGVGTALIFATLLANRLGADLRVITRTERPQPDNVDHILSVYGLALKGEIQFKFLSVHERNQSTDFLESELFITTSWWTTASTLGSVPASSILYLLQEDERMFYPFGDDRLRCEDILGRRDIRFLINTKLLFDHLVADGLPNIANHGTWFEPAFPTRVFHPSTVKQEPESKRKFIFYARPNNLRNLFYLGIEAIETAIAQHVLDPKVWEIIFVGKDIPDIVFVDGHAPTKRENLSWSEYADLAGTMDLGLSLMYTPHPSYPPLDLAASGAVVVTNQFGIKQDLLRYSANLICAKAERDALVGALREGVALALNQPLRQKNFEGNGLCTDWKVSFAETIERIAGKN